MKHATSKFSLTTAGKTTMALLVGSFTGAVLAWDVPTNLGERNDALVWDSDAPSYNIYEDGGYIATVHGAKLYEPIFSNSEYQVVAHDHGNQFTAVSASFLYLDDDEDDEDSEQGDSEDLEFDEAELYFELNNTDGDLGIHSVVDGDAWTNLVYEDIDGRVLIDVQVSGAMAEQGLTEFFFESAEPTFDELPPADFFSRFPAGIYDFEGTTVEGENIEAEATLSHVLPAPAVVYVGANPLGAFEGCEDDPALDPSAMMELSGELRVRWDPVTTHHPEIGMPGEVEVEVYQFFYEGEDVHLSVDLDADTTEFIIPAAFVRSGTAGKLEVVVRDSTHNQVGTEACFQIQ